MTFAEIKATLKYFTIFGEEGLNADLLKNLWRKIAVKVHPDKGGSHDQYLEAQREYETLLQYVNAGFSAVSDSPEAYNDFMSFLAGISPIVKDCVKAVVAIEGIRAIEITGYWVWVTIAREDVAERKMLKTILIDGKRFTWFNKHAKWVWKGKPARGRRNMSWDEKKSFWGHDQYQKDQALG